MTIDRQYCRWCFAGSLALLALSFVAYVLPSVQSIFFILAIGLTLIVALWRLESALYLVLAELGIGSFGYLLSVSMGGVNLSLRIGMFAVIMAVWLGRVLVELARTKSFGRYVSLRHTALGKYFLLLLVVLVWGALWGWWRGHGLRGVFFDSNGWLYFLYLLPFVDCLKRERLPQILAVLAGSIAAMTVLTVLTFLVFTQNWAALVSPLYGWLRDFRLGEITFAGGNLWRVFLQSQVYAAVGSVLFFWLWLKNNNYELRITNYEFGVFTLASFTVIISLSRSFWLGCAGALALMFWWLLLKEQVPLKKLFLAGLLLIVVVGVEFGAIRLIAGAGSGELISQRLTDFGEAAGASRWNQLRPLSLAITRHPIIGSGFGAPVTYQSLDPRILKNSPDGWYTTYAFEWGYLDVLLKVGLFGLGVYLLFLYQVGKKLIITNDELQMGLFFGLVVILLTNIFSPYLNHPLGIGYIVVLASLI
ncbi:O-antigen ligase family protein [Candidatus Falkowbacteria bacterium]|nr:O-antigen ligase family protein [Candidatus Falkowbacteria bacterium]